MQYYSEFSGVSQLDDIKYRRSAWLLLPGYTPHSMITFYLNVRSLRGLGIGSVEILIVFR